MSALGELKDCQRVAGGLRENLLTPHRIEVRVRNSLQERTGVVVGQSPHLKFREIDELWRNLANSKDETDRLGLKSPADKRESLQRSSVERIGVVDDVD